MDATSVLSRPVQSIRLPEYVVKSWKERHNQRPYMRRPTVGVRRQRIIGSVAHLKGRGTRLRASCPTKTRMALFFADFVADDRELFSQATNLADSVGVGELQNTS